MFKVGHVDPAGRFGFLRSRLSAPDTVVGETIRQVAQSDLGSIFCREPRQPIRAASRTDAASDADHDERIEDEAVAVVHSLMFVVCPSSSSPISPATRVARQSTRPLRANGGHPRYGKSVELTPRSQPRSEEMTWSSFPPVLLAEPTPPPDPTQPAPARPKGPAAASHRRRTRACGYSTSAAAACPGGTSRYRCAAPQSDTEVPRL